jgi:hypothetical protein
MADPVPLKGVQEYALEDPLSTTKDRQLIGSVSVLGQRLLHGRAPVPQRVERPHVDGLPLDGREKGWCLTVRRPLQAPAEYKLVAWDQAAPDSMLLFDLLLDQMAVGIVTVRYDPNPWFHGALLLWKSSQASGLVQKAGMRNS